MKRVLPDYREKQKILNIDQNSREALIAYGQKFSNANRLFDALEFYRKAKHRPGLEEIMEVAISFGDSMLFEQSAKALGRAPSAEEWNRVGRRAFDLKKYLFARYAFERGHNDAMLEEIRKVAAGGDVLAV